MFKGFAITQDFHDKVVASRNYNETILKYFNVFKESGNIFITKEILERNANAIEFCNKFWTLDFYQEQEIKNLIKTNLCRNKFCSNCKKVTQSVRVAKYTPVLSEHRDKLFHFVLTQPNCSGDMLRHTVLKMSKSFKKLINYLTGYKKIRGLNFEQYGYKGCVRSLEITFKGDSYHPHYHVAFAFDNLILDKNITNIYSYNLKGSYAELTRKFSDFEIILQKIWKLLMTDEIVNKKNIDSLDVGYSCIVDKFKEDNYAELFKYMTKEVNEDGKVLNYSNFVNLYVGTYRIKQIQGYGIFYKITDNVDVDELIDGYNLYLEMLEQKEKPLRVLEYVSQSDRQKALNTKLKVVDLSKCNYISFKSYVQYLNDYE